MNWRNLVYHAMVIVVITIVIFLIFWSVIEITNDLRCKDYDFDNGTVFFERGWFRSYCFNTVFIDGVFKKVYYPFDEKEMIFIDGVEIPE